MPNVWKTAYRVEIGRAEHYDRVKRVLNRGHHPTFVGRDMVERCAMNGGVLLFVIDNEDAAVAVVNTRTNSLVVLCVDPRLRGRGLGAEVVRFLKPNWVRAVEAAVPFFERLGYQCVGEWKQGRALRTRVMVRGPLLTLAGRLRSRMSNRE